MVKRGCNFSTQAERGSIGLSLVSPCLKARLEEGNLEAGNVDT